MKNKRFHYVAEMGSDRHLIVHEVPEARAEPEWQRVKLESPTKRAAFGSAIDEAAAVSSLEKRWGAVRHTVHRIPLSKQALLMERIGATLTPAEIKRKYDALGKKSARNTERFIAAGRGHERSSDYMKKDDPLSLEARQIASEQDALETEARKYAGPHYRHVLSHGAKWMR